MFRAARPETRAAVGARTRGRAGRGRDGRSPERWTWSQGGGRARGRQGADVPLRSPTPCPARPSWRVGQALAGASAGRRSAQCPPREPDSTRSCALSERGSSLQDEKGRSDGEPESRGALPSARHLKTREMRADRVEGRNAARQPGAPPLSGPGAEPVALARKLCQGEFPAAGGGSARRARAASPVRVQLPARGLLLGTIPVPGLCPWSVSRSPRASYSHAATRGRCPLHGRPPGARPAAWWGPSPPQWAAVLPSAPEGSRPPGPALCSQQGRRSLAPGCHWSGVLLPPEQGGKPPPYPPPVVPGARVSGQKPPRGQQGT